jgi:hypothetical protein
MRGGEKQHARNNKIDSDEHPINTKWLNLTDYILNHEKDNFLDTTTKSSKTKNHKEAR